MGIKSTLQTLLTYSKFIPLTLSFLWLVLVIRYLDIKPQYPTRDYLKLLNNGSKTNGIVRMNTVHFLNKFEQNNQNNNNLVEQFSYFNLLHLAQGKNKINCEKNLRILVINANFKQIGDNYLALYKEIEKLNPYCRYSVYELNRKHHLLMNSQFLITNYAIEVAMTIQYFVNNGQAGHLSLLTFEQGCSILIKAFQILPNFVIEKIGAVILINAFNFNLQINYDNPSIFFKSTFESIEQNKQKVQVMNETRLIFISTTNYWDKNRYEEQDQQKFVFLIRGKKLQKTVFLNTRFMRNIYSLLHQKDYFALTQLSMRITKFLMLDSIRKRRVQQIQYFFNYGELYTKVDYQFKSNRNKYCGRAKLNKLSKITKVIQTLCVVIQIASKLREGNQSLLLITSKQSNIYNDRFQKIEPIFQRYQYLYYIFEKVKDTKQITILNSNRNQSVFIQFHQPYGPISNPLPNQFFFKFNPSIFSNKVNKSFAQERKLIKVCPNGQYLIFPQHYYYIGNSLLTSLTILNLNKIIFDFTKFQQKTTIEDCYSDFFTQTYFLPSEIIKNWPFQRNLILLILLCSYARKESILSKTYLYIVILTFYRIFLTDKIVVFLDFLLISLGVGVEAIINITIHLVKTIQEIIDKKYRRLMILITLAIAVTKALNNNNPYINQLSAWKLLCICLIFVINRSNVLILFCKLYFLADHIIYNHNDCFEISIILLWLFVTQNYQDIDQDKKQNDPKNQKMQADNKNGNKMKSQPDKVNNQSRSIQTIMVMFVTLFINGHSQFLNISLTVYIIFKSLRSSFSQNYLHAQK